MTAQDAAQAVDPCPLPIGPATHVAASPLAFALRSSTVEESGAAADCLGPIPQAHFLLGLGIEARLEALVQRATPEQAEALRAGFRWA